VPAVHEKLLPVGISLVWFMILPGSVLAQTEDPSTEGDSFLLSGEHVALAQWGAIAVTVSNQASDGCWTSADASKNAVTLALRRNGLTVVEGGLTDLGLTNLVMTLRVTGYETAGICAASYETSVMKAIITQVIIPQGGGSMQNIKSVGQFTIWSTEGLITGDKSDFSARIRQKFVESADEFLVDYFESTDKVAKMGPSLQWNRVPPELN